MNHYILLAFQKIRDDNILTKRLFIMNKNNEKKKKKKKKSLNIIYLIDRVCVCVCDFIALVT